MFARIDYKKRQLIDSIDLCAFFRDNGMIVSEADCYMLVRTFDSNGDGMLSLVDLMLILCPRSYTYQKNYVNSRKFYQYGVQQV